MAEAAPDYIALGIYAGASFLLIVLLLALSRFLGRRTRGPAKDEPFEGGIRPSGPARVGERVPYYLVAVLFLIFDLEAVFIVSFALAFDALGFAGFVQIAFFIGVLLVALWYLLRAGALDWGPRAARGGEAVSKERPI